MTTALVARPVDARLRPLYATGFNHEFALWYSIEKLFMRRRMQMFDSVAFITGAPLSPGTAHFGSLQLEYFITIPFTCCAFFTLHGFRWPSLHRTAPGARLSAQLGQVPRAATQADVTWITFCLVANANGIWPAVRRARCCATRRERPVPGSR